MSIESISLQPIGYVRHAIPDDEVSRKRRELEADIEIVAEYRDALTGLEAYSHLFVLFWMHRTPRADFTHRVHPRGRPELPLTGVFATRGRQRPNPIGLAVVELLGLIETGLRVRRLDAYDGTPILDIKPYDECDVFTDLKLPEWWLGLQTKPSP